MVDKLFKSIFTSLDNAFGIEKETDAEKVVELNLSKTIESQTEAHDCIIHKMKRRYFCEECVLELCGLCCRKHDGEHTIRFIEDTSKYITEHFRDGL